MSKDMDVRQAVARHCFGVSDLVTRTHHRHKEIHVDDEAQYQPDCTALDTLQGLALQRQLEAGYGAVQPVSADAQKRHEQRAQAEEARWIAQQAGERDERSRQLALQLAAAVAGTSGDAAAVIDAAEGFLNFLTGAEKRPH